MLNIYTERSKAQRGPQKPLLRFAQETQRNVGVLLHPVATLSWSSSVPTR